MQAIRFNNLVYIPITKHASTSYTNLFKDRLGWERTQTHQIDWNQDRVFAHIIDPFERHLKGIFQCLVKYDLLDLLEHPKFKTLLGTAVFDLHSYPLSVSFGDNIHKIDWLLLDHPRYSGNYVTCKFLQSQGVNIKETDIPQEHVGSPKSKQLIDQIRQLRTSNGLSGILYYFYEQDALLYNLVKNNTMLDKIETHAWDEISWLTNKPKQ